MELKYYLKHLVEHSNWANRRILRAFGQHHSGDAVQLFAHILTTENVDYRRITGLEPWPLEFWTKLSLEEFLKLRYLEMPRSMLRNAIEKFPELLRKVYLKGEVM